MLAEDDHELEANSDRMSELKAFDATKAGVKGLLYTDLTKIPSIFYSSSRPSFDEKKLQSDDQGLKYREFRKYRCVPIIDLRGIQNDAVSRARVVEKVRHASEKWGFFQDSEVKKEFYSRFSGVPNNS
ncbi:hypothetical protein L3X38_000901 [Prunus dulcis]|uniref:2-oxoglutarate and Fe(II)-dependent oxygenase superfamily protein n=1 Tax=Prunus dulcis TaxID=3755 RepID=A0AAD4WR48_PRUDU|nr:hypothetical protein L3X38_000901 [Prunus dulcis]